MKRLHVTLILIAVIMQCLLFATGCGNDTAVGEYYRDFGNYISTTMYIELKNDNTYQTDGTDPNLLSEGTYDIDGSVITFTFKYSWESEQDSAHTFTGTITDDTLTVGKITYRK